LIVDDEAPVANLLEQALRNEGYEVAVAVDGILTINGKKTPGAHLTKIVQKEIQKEEFLVVVLETDRDTEYGAFVQVLDDLKKAGATRIAIEDPSK